MAQIVSNKIRANPRVPRTMHLFRHVAGFFALIMNADSDFHLR